jgi:hypothetical protein
MNLDKIKRKQIDPTASGLGAAGVLPRIDNPEAALQPLTPELWARMEHDYHHGREKGQSCHIPELNRYFKWMPGYTNVITGWGGHGKSQFFFELLLLRAVFDGKKSAVWPSENLPAERFYDGLIHTLTGLNPDRSWSPHLPLAEYRRATDFVREHFVVVAPPMGMPYTPAHLLAYFEAAIAKYGVEHCMLDPWNKCDHSALGRMGGIEPYLIHTLGLCTQWSQTTRQSLIITAHPKRLEDMGFGKTRPVPDGASISGGQTWENMAHYIGAVHRPYKHLEGDNRAAFYSHKVKDEKLVASTGSVGANYADNTPPSVPLIFDTVSNRYRWGHQRLNPLDSPDVRQLYTATLDTSAEQLSADWSPNGRPVTLPQA